MLTNWNGNKKILNVYFTYCQWITGNQNVRTNVYNSSKNWKFRYLTKHVHCLFVCCKIQHSKDLSSPQSVDFQEAFSVVTNKLILKFIWEGKSTRFAKMILQKNKFGIIILLNFTIYYKAAVIIACVNRIDL